MYSAHLPICRLPFASGTAGREQLAFDLNGGREFQGKYPTEKTDKIRCEIWQATSGIGDLNLGIAFFTEHRQLLLNTVHILRPGRATTSEVDRGIVVKTFPVAN